VIDQIGIALPGVTAIFLSQCRAYGFIGCARRQEVNRESELRFLTGCLGIQGEVRKAVIRNAVLAYGASKPLLMHEEETAADVFRNVFGESP
jgi:hypothetical protein